MSAYKDGAYNDKVATPLQDEDSGIVRVPYEAISRPLVEAHDEGFAPGFLAEQRLADLLFRRRIRRAGRGMVLCDGRMYDLHGAVRVLGPTGSERDPYGLTGLVERVDDLRQAGAVIGPATMALGSFTYRIERGVLAVAHAAEEPLAG